VTPKQLHSGTGKKEVKGKGMVQKKKDAEQKRAELDHGSSEKMESRGRERGRENPTKGF